MRVNSLALLFTIISLPFIILSQNEEKDYSEAFELIDVWLEAQKDFEKLPGITAVMVKDQDITWSGAFGMAHAKEEVEMETSTLFSICSISKLFTAIAIMKLYDEGKLRLDDRIEDVLPWYDLKQQYTDSGPITIRSLLTHSSGLPREANAPYWTGPDFPFPTMEKVKEGLKEQETLYPASKWFQYSNLGLSLLGEIVEEVSGVSYDEYIQKHILTPMGLEDTHTEMPEDLYGNKLAVGYSSIKRNGERENVNLFQANGIKAAAGFSSNVLDLAKFASWQFRLLDTTTTEIIKPSTLKNMYNVHWVDPDWNVNWGLGFNVSKGTDGKKTVSHGGSCPGYRSVFLLHPKSKRAFAVMINAGGTNPEKYAAGINAIISKADADAKKLSPKEKENAPDLNAYKGFYDSTPWGSEIYIAPWNGKLVSLSLPANSPAEAMTFYKHIKGDTFQRIRDDGELGETREFERNSNGQVWRYKQHGNYTVKWMNR